MRFGDLNGTWGYVAATYGMAIGEYAASLPNITVDPTNGLRIRIFNGTPVLQLDTSGNADITNKLRMPGASSAIAIGSTPPTGAAAGTGLWLDRTGLYCAQRRHLRVKIDAATGKLYAGGGNVEVDTTGLHLDVADSGTGYLYFYGSLLAATPGGAIYGMSSGTNYTLTARAKNNVSILSGDYALKCRIFSRIGRDWRRLPDLRHRRNSEQARHWRDGPLLHHEQ